MANPLEKEVVVTEGGTTPQSTDRHRSPDFPPSIQSILAGVSVAFDNDAPNQYYRPIDAVIKLRIEVPPGPNVPAGSNLCTIKFGSEYVDSGGKPLPPIVLDCDESPGFATAIRALWLTSNTFMLRNDNVLPNGIFRLRFVTQPSL